MNCVFYGLICSRKEWIRTELWDEIIIGDGIALCFELSGGLIDCRGSHRIRVLAS